MSLTMIKHGNPGGVPDPSGDGLRRATPGSVHAMTEVPPQPGTPDPTDHDRPTPIVPVPGPEAARRPLALWV